MRLLLFIAIMLLTSWHGLVCGESSRGLGIDSTWIELDKIQEVERLIKVNDYKRAQILFDILLEKNPNSTSVNALSAFFSGVKDSGDKILGKQSDDSLLNRWIKYKSYRSEGDLSYAWKYIKDIERRCEVEAVKPVFYPELVEELRSLNRAISLSLKGKFLQFDKKIDNYKNYDSTHNKLVEFVELYSENSAMLNSYQGLPILLEYKYKLKKQIENAARIEFSKVKIVKEFNGCSAALKKYVELKGLLKFSDLPFYNEIQNEIEICKKI